MTNLLHRNDKSVTAHNKLSKNPQINLRTLCISCAKIACCSSELIFAFLYAGNSIHNANDQFASSIHIYFLT